MQTRSSGDAVNHCDRGFGKGGKGLHHVTAGREQVVQERFAIVGRITVAIDFFQIVTGAKDVTGP